LILIGTLEGYASVFVGLFPNEDSSCVAQIWLMGLSYMFIFPCVYVRVYRVWLITHKAEKLKKVKISLFQVLIPVIVSVIVESVFLLLWTLFSPPHITYVDVVNDGIYQTCFDPNSESELIFWVVFISYKTVMLFGGVYLAFVSRKVEKSLNESKHIAWSIYVTGVVVVVFVSIGFILVSSPVVTLLLSTIGLEIPYIFTTVVLFVDPIIDIIRGKESIAARLRKRAQKPCTELDTSEHNT